MSCEIEPDCKAVTASQLPWLRNRGNITKDNAKKVAAGSDSGNCLDGVCRPRVHVLEAEGGLVPFELRVHRLPKVDREVKQAPPVALMTYGEKVLARWGRLKDDQTFLFGG